MTDQEEQNIQDEGAPSPDVPEPEVTVPDGSEGEGGSAPVDAGDAADVAQASLEEAQRATDEIDSASSDPATPVDQAIDEKTAEALRAAQEAIASLKTPDSDGAGADATASDGDVFAQLADQAEAQPMSLPAVEGADLNGRVSGVDLLADVNLQVKIELGRTRMLVEDVLRLGEGAVVELDKAAGDPVDIYVNDRPVARGEVLVINDCFCVRISEILEAAKPD